MDNSDGKGAIKTLASFEYIGAADAKPKLNLVIWRARSVWGKNSLA